MGQFLMTPKLACKTVEIFIKSLAELL